MIMKKLLLQLFMLLFSSSILYAQQDVTKFLGIPVDGSESTMIRKLRAKGFKYAFDDSNILSGRFNGEDVLIAFRSNNGKLWRVAVIENAQRDEMNIKIRFNDLCRQFMNTGRYVPATLSTDFIIPEEEDISYGMAVENKRYQAVFYQLPEDTAALSDSIQAYLLSKYTEEELHNLTEKDERRMAIETYSYLVAASLHKSVWFMINEQYGEYDISIFYDNECNKAKGEDL